MWYDSFWIYMGYYIIIEISLTLQNYIQWNAFVGFPGGALVKNLPVSAGDMGSSPGPEDLTCRGETKPRAPQLMSLRSRAREPQLLSPCATTTEARVPRARAPQQEKPPQWEARALQQRVAPARRN